VGVKRPGPEADHSSPSSAEVKCVYVYLYSPNKPSWRGAQLKKAQRQVYLCLYTGLLSCYAVCCFPQSMLMKG
jgi:hypothetical protein